MSKDDKCLVVGTTALSANHKLMAYAQMSKKSCDLEPNVIGQDSGEHSETYRPMAHRERDSGKQRETQ